MIKLIMLILIAWLIAPPILMFVLFDARRRLKQLRERSLSQSDRATSFPPQPSTHTVKLPNQQVSDLVVLRLEVGQLLVAGQIDRTLYEQVIERIDTLWSEILGGLGTLPESAQWQKGRDAAWELLIQHQPFPPGPPPWRATEEAKPQLEQAWARKLGVKPQPAPLLKAESPNEALTLVSEPRPLAQPQGTVLIPPLSPGSSDLLRESPRQQRPAVSVPLRARESERQPTQPQTTPALSPSASLIPQAEQDDTADYAWKPTLPNALERALQTVSGWPALITPFLVQNIGWFIGGLCFVAGSIFLVSYTTGFAKALTVSTVLLAYTAFILWAGYQLRRRRPELETSSSVLFTLGVLLVPLNVAASVRLIATGQHVLGLIVGGLVTAVVLGGLYFATMLASGVMDRSLQGRHPQIFLALAAVQLAVPLLVRFPSWLLLAFLHLLLLGLLAYGLVLFTRDWLHSIFVERRKIAYYAAGTLVYAALVSFVHLTWGYKHPLALPGGYYSPFLMALCGLLFYVDVQLKQWTKQYVFLSRFSFALYGLSILALLLSVHTSPARLITLLLAVGLYSMVVWQYLTLPPLYLLLGCLSWLYSLLILQYLPSHWHLFTSLPGLAGLFAASRWLQHRQSASLARVCYRVWMGAAFALTGWSLLHAQPGLVAMGTALTMMGVAFYGLRSAPAQLLGGASAPESEVNLRNGPWLYTVTLMGSVAVTYTPQWLGLVWTTQCAFGLTLLALLWTALALHLRRGASQAQTPQMEVLLNSALVNLGFCLLLVVVLAMPGITQHRSLPLVLAAMGGVLLWLSLELRVQWLFYGVLGLWGVAGAIVKVTYFPAPSTGVVEMLLAVAVWALLWWLDHEPEEVRTLRREQAALLASQEPRVTLLWHFSVSRNHTYEAMLRMPLQQAMVVLWSIGLGHLGLRLLEDRLGWGWVLSASLGAMETLLGAGHFRLPWLLPSAMLLGLGAWLTVVFKLGAPTVTGLGFAGASYALLVWRFGVYALAHPITPHFARVLHLSGGRALAEECLHWTAFAITLPCIAVPLGQYGLFTPSVAMLFTFITSMTFLWLAGQQYQQQLHSYTLLGIAVLGTLLCYAWVSPFSAPQHPAPLQGLLRDPGLGLLLALLGLSLWAIAWKLSSHTNSPEENRADSDRSLYRTPLRVVAVLLALLAADQQLALVWRDAAHPVGPVSIAVLFLASTGLLLANHALRYPALNLIGILLAVLAMLWTEASLLHGSTAFSLWPGGRVFTDQWLTLAILAVGLSSLAQRLSRAARWEQLYTQPLYIAAVVTCGWALFGVLTLFAIEPSRIDGWLACVFLTLTLSSFLMLGNSSWIGFPWLAGLTLMCAGLVFNVAWVRAVFLQSSVEHLLFSQNSPVILVLANLFWANIMLRAVPLWRQHGRALSDRWHWRDHDLVTPFLGWPSVVFLGQLLRFALLQTLPLLFSVPTANAFSLSSHVCIGSLLTVSFLHLWWLHRAAWESHTLLFSLLCTFLALWLGSAAHLFHLPLFLALWSVALLSAHSLWEKNQWGAEVSLPLRHTLSTWLDPSLLAAIAALTLIPQVPVGESLVTLSVLIIAAAGLGWQRQQSSWLLVAMVMFLVLLHRWPLLWVPFSQAALLLPWYALQLASLSWFLLWLYNRVTETCRGSMNQALPESDESDSSKKGGKEAAGETSAYNARLKEISLLLPWAWSGVAALALLEWALHQFYLFGFLSATGTPQWLTDGDAAAALLAALLLLTLGIRQAWLSQQAEWIYGVAAFGGAIGMYIRWLLVGLAPVTVWDTAALMGVTYVLFIIQRLAPSEPLLHVILVLPLFALLTVPLQLTSPHAGATLMTAGMLYLLTHRETGQPFPLYLAFLAFNVAIYLWVPDWANHYQVFQVYAVPAALSVLLLLHLHRQELQPSVLNSARLATISILYASATLDVFLQDELVIFGVVLALSLAGIIVGIALRTRAFLYSGVTFLVLNVLAQLILLFPEQRLGKAIMLLVLGAAITGGMIWFNLQREMILQRIRIFRADLETWT